MEEALLCAREALHRLSAAEVRPAGLVLNIKPHLCLDCQEKQRQGPGRRIWFACQEFWDQEELRESEQYKEKYDQEKRYKEKYDLERTKKDREKYNKEKRDKEKHDSERTKNDRAKHHTEKYDQEKYDKEKSRRGRSASESTRPPRRRSRSRSRPPLPRLPWRFNKRPRLVLRERERSEEPRGGRR